MDLSREKWIGPPPRRIAVTKLKTAPASVVRHHPRMRTTGTNELDKWMYKVRLSGVVTHLPPFDPRWAEGGTPEVPEWAYVGYLAECASDKSSQVIDKSFLGSYFRAYMPWLHRKYVRLDTPSPAGAVTLRQTLVYYHVGMLTR